MTKGPFLSLSVLHNLPKGSLNLSLAPKLSPPKTHYTNSSESPNDSNKKTMLSEEIEEGKKAINLKDLNISLLDQRVISHYIKNPCVSGGNLTQRSPSITQIPRQNALPSSSVVSAGIRRYHRDLSRDSHFLDKTLTMSKVLTPSASLSSIRNKKTIFSPLKVSRSVKELERINFGLMKEVS